MRKNILVFKANKILNGKTHFKVWIPAFALRGGVPYGTESGITVQKTNLQVVTPANAGVQVLG
jgi:hypothetical protein